MLGQGIPKDAELPHILPGIYPLSPNVFDRPDIRSILVVWIEVEPDETRVMNGDQLEPGAILEVGIDEIQ